MSATDDTPEEIRRMKTSEIVEAIARAHAGTTPDPRGPGFVAEHADRMRSIVPLCAELDARIPARES